MGLDNTRFYVDDGYTGTNFNRPGFQSMLDDIDMGYISTVMVKDLSRLGRDYVSVGYYTDQYFPERNIRFIAVNDGIDSDEGESEIAPFKNILNEMYARDISKKIRSSHRLRGNAGEPLAQPPYGYMKSPENKKKWMQLSHKYETERLELKAKITELRRKLTDMGSRQQERENFIHAIRRFMEMDRLTAPLLRELIDHIDVFETEGVGKSRTQRIVIYYRFVGYIELPDSYFRSNYKADTRKGVAVEYIPTIPA